MIQVVALLAVLTASQSNQPFRAGTQEVLLDFVARDKHQHAVKNLRPEEVLIYEDGVLQHATSFRYRSGADEAESKVEGSANAYNPLRELNIVSIVFESMSAETRRRATEYANEFLNTSIGPNIFIGVFTLNRRLSVVQPYTSDLVLLRQAVQRAGTGGYQQFAKESQDRLTHINSLLATANSPQFQPLSPGSAEERGPAGGLGKAAAALLLDIEQHALKENYEQTGIRNIDALRSLIAAQQQLPGRKTIFYISEGLVIPPERPELLRSVISEANRANVTFYTLDARGLQVTSGMRASDIATTSLNTDFGTSDAGAPVQQTDLQINARELAERTGGFAMDNSNDLRAPLHWVMEDVQAHYEVAYTPASATLDGRFHTIDVKVLRKGILLQSRKGYFALPMMNGETLPMVEVAALNALEASPAPKQLSFESAALDYGAEQRSIAFAMPAKLARFTEDLATRTFRVHVASLALVKNEESGNVVARLFRDLPYQGPLERRIEFENGLITLTSPLSLDPGHYRVETVLLDVDASAAGTRVFSLVVPPHPSHLELSDFIWIRSASAGRIIPELTPVFTRGISPAFFFKTYVPLGSATPAAELAITRDGSSVRRMKLTLPSAGEDGWITFTGNLPTQDLAAGIYEIQLAVRDDKTEVTRMASMILH